jgi:cation:H+ antiporter
LNAVAAIYDLALMQDPLFLVGLFMGGSLLMIWRLEHMTQTGLEGTVLGTLVMPYCSGIGNLVLVFVARSQMVDGREVVVNCLVNNVTNMTLLIGLPAVFWGVSQRKSKPNRKKKEVAAQRLNRLSIFLTLTAVLFFTGVTWALGSDDGRFSRKDGLVLVALFLFWQCFHVFDVLKTNVRQNRSLSWMLALDFALLLMGGFDVYLSVQGLVAWLKQLDPGVLNESKDSIGWLTGWLMVLPNALLALYYGWRRRPEVVYTSQIGDGHICIPLCIGLAALVAPAAHPVATPGLFQPGTLILTGAVLIHFLVVGWFGQLPRFFGVVLTVIYCWFLYTGLLA